MTGTKETPKTESHALLSGVSGFTDNQPKTLLECGVCWGGGEIDINDDMETIKCHRCNGTGVIKNY